MSSSPSNAVAQSGAKRTLLKLGAVVLALAAVGGGAIAFASQSKAPDVTFTSIEGKKIVLKDLRGKVVMVNFWATSCTTCVADMQHMAKTYNAYHAKGLDYVAVAMSYDPPNYVLNFARTRALPFNVALDPEQTAANAFGDVQLTPTTFVIDKNGKIIKRYVGAPDEVELNQLLDKALAA
jgi:peroxiredoxin